MHVYPQIVFLRKMAEEGRDPIGALPSGQLTVTHWEPERADSGEVAG